MSQAPSGHTYGVCSDVTGEAYAEAMAMWDDLERRHGLREARAAIHPHVSYLVGECEQPEALGAALAAAAPGLTPLIVDIDGVGVFEGAQPVVFLRVAKGPALVEAHSRIGEATRGLWARVWPHYLPDAWCPHVTLALRDLAPERLGPVLAELEDRRTGFSTRLDSLDLVHVVFPRHVSLGRWALGGPSRQQPEAHGT